MRKRHHVAPIGQNGFMPENDHQKVASKIHRIQAGGSLRLLDLFSGCGGLTLGFHQAGATPIGGIEIDRHAAASHSANFHGGSPLHSRPLDIRAVEPLELLREWSAEAKVEVEADLIVAGPPCPSFTRVGRAKLREIANHPEAYRFDERTELYLHFLRIVSKLTPLAVLVENVPDILNHGGVNVGEIIASNLDTLGYDTKYTLLNSAQYGVPQMRERFFLLGIRKELEAEIHFPNPTNRVEFPIGYEGSRAVATRLVRQIESVTSLESVNSHFVPSPSPLENAPKAISARQAIADLPRLTKHLKGLDRRGARRFDIGVPFSPKPTRSEYAKIMAEWPGFAFDGFLYDHVTRSLSNRDYRLFARMQPGDEYPKAYDLAVRLWENETASDPAKYSEYVPPYDPSKFPNKWRKMEADLPARTLMAHLGKDTYSHIHFDSSQARTISVREAARLQSFPDGFKFCGTMNPAFRQIGNSVPPLLAAAVASELVQSIHDACEDRRSGAA